MCSILSKIRNTKYSSLKLDMKNAVCVIGSVDRSLAVVSDLVYMRDNLDIWIDLYDIVVNLIWFTGIS